MVRLDSASEIKQPIGAYTQGVGNVKNDVERDCAVGGFDTVCVGCGGEEELGMDPESMAVAYMKAFIECDTDAALDAANIDAIKDMLWYYSGDDYSYSEFEDMWSSIEYDKGKVVSVKVSISGSSDSSSNTFDVPVMYFDGQRTTPSR